MVSKLRRLAADHGALHSALPPYYLLPPDDGKCAASDDLSQLSILLTGPPGTPYSQGLWRLHLKMPDDYPHSPPKATFKTRIWHPNMEEPSGAVCVDTLKRDWQPQLTLRDVLVTISCLLIHPNPDSALNSSAGALLQEDYEAFAHQARLMTSIHAPIPPALKDAVTEAKLRGEDDGAVIEDRDETQYARPRKEQRVQNVTMKKRKVNSADHPSLPPSEVPVDNFHNMSEVGMSEDESEDSASESKENDPSLSPTPVTLAPPSPRKTALGKRPLSVLSTPFRDDPDSDMMLVDEDGDTDTPSMTSSEQNIFANNAAARPTGSLQRKSPQLSLLNRGINVSGRVRDDLQIFEDGCDMAVQDVSRRCSGVGKENPSGLKETREFQATKAVNGSNPFPAGQVQALPASARARSASDEPWKVVKKAANGVRKVSSSTTKTKPRIGVRRL